MGNEEKKMSEFRQILVNEIKKEILYLRQNETFAFWYAIIHDIRWYGDTIMGWSYKEEKEVPELNDMVFRVYQLDFAGNMQERLRK